MGTCPAGVGDGAQGARRAPVSRHLGISSYSVLPFPGQ